MASIDMIDMISKVQVDKNHKYIIKENNEVIYSVTSIINKIDPNKQPISPTFAMKMGTVFHEKLSEYINSDRNDEKFIENISIFEEKLQKLIKEIKTYIDRYLKKYPDLKDCSEVKFIHRCKTHYIKYAGTADLFIDNTIIEFKTGPYSRKYALQVAAYAKALGANKAEVLFYDKENDCLGIKILFKDDIETYYQEFVTLSHEYYEQYDNCKFSNKVKIKDKDINKLLTKLEKLIDLKKETEDEIQEIKTQIYEIMEENKYSKYKGDSLACTISEPRVLYTLITEQKKELLKTNPEYFKITHVGPSLMITKVKDKTEGK